MDTGNVIIMGQIAIDGGPPRPCQLQGLVVPLPPGVDPPPMPSHPIVIPDPPTEPPLVIWGPDDPRPTPPIWWPGYPAWPPTGSSPPVPPNKWYWHYCDDVLGWVLVPPGGGGKPQ